MNPDLRSVAMATRGLLGLEVDLDFGPHPGWHSQQVWIPPTPAEGLTRLLLCLQASSMSQAPIDSRNPDPWAAILHNLLVAKVLRTRLPGLHPVFDALEDAWWDTVGGAGISSDLGVLLLGSLTPSWERWATGSPGTQGSLLRARAEASRWLRDPVGATPVPPFPPPKWLPLHHAHPLPEVSDQKVPGGGSSSITRGTVPLFVLAPSFPSSPRVLVTGPDPLSPAGGAVDVPPDRSTQDSTESRSGPCRHDEWDSERGTYLHQWCSVYDLTAMSDRTGSDPTVTRSAMRRVRRMFESRAHPATARRHELDGQEIDIDAVIAAAAQGRVSDDELVYFDRARAAGDTAIAVVADLSESTGGWTLDLERSALVLLGEALDAVGDQFSLLGFRGRSRHDCQVVWIKRFPDRWGTSTRARIRAVEASGFTRIAPCLRHVGQVLSATDCHNRILLLISDGIPYDVSGYGGAYAVEDTRRAFYELRARGIKPYCLTIDVSARHYLTRMCGPAAWTLVNDRERLPEALLRLYRRVRF